MKAIRANLAKVAAHDFWRSMRAWGSDIEPHQLVQMLSDQRARTLKNSLQSLFLALVLTLWITNSKVGSDVTLEILSLSLTVPVIYVSFAISFLNLATVVSYLSHLHLNEFLRLAVKRFYGFDNSTVMAILYDGSSAWSLGVMQQYRFLKSKPLHNLFTFSSLIAIFLPLIAVFFYIYLVVIDISVSSLSLTISSPFGIALSIISLLLLAYAIALVVTIYVPHTFEKNENYVRWNFLSSEIYRRNFLDHRHLKKWLDK